MRRIVPIALALLTAALLSKEAVAQTAAYDRPTVNFVLLTYGDSYDAPTSAFFKKIPPEEKFYFNELNTRELKLRQQSRQTPLPTAWQAAQAELTLQNVAKQEVAAWYLRKLDGSMSMELIHRRGEFNATDEAFLMATATKRGMDELKDLGQKLISKTYVVLVDYNSITYSANVATDMHTWKSVARAMVFRLKFDGNVENSIYDAWQDEQDTPEAQAEKGKRFDQIPFELEFVQQVSVKASASALITGKTRSDQSTLQTLAKSAFRVQPKDALMNEMLGNGYRGLMNELEKKVPAFKVLSGVWELDPIRSKIGRKEGLRTDQRYYVLEYEQDRRGQLKSVRKAVVRVSSVADNYGMATGKSEASSFYQVAGQRVEKGMTLEQRNDAGLGVLLGANTPLSGDAYFSTELRLELLTRVIPSLYVYGEGTLEGARYALSSSFKVDYELTGNGKEDYLFARAGFGFGKNIHFWRNFSLSPYVGMGWEFTSAKQISLETMYFKGGANFALNIYYPLQLVGGVSGLLYGSPSSSKKDDDGNKISFSSYGKVFSERSSVGAAVFMGVRFNF
ncbi:MAG: hypothetical protein LBT94_02460 [Prevotellaceae bacterium]|nr:hypothetical protein [Prevotellaceae bacterium]